MTERVGQHLGNYRLTRLLGKGAFADVYLGEHIYLNSSAALKVLRTPLDAHATEAFLTEARHLSHLAHPHIIRVLDFGMENQISYLVMEYAPYGNVRELYPPGTAVPLATIVSYTSAIASALQYAHDQHLLHRDLKPENLLLGPKREVLLSDFGLALLTSGSRPLQVQERFGTLAYMAPEQIRGQPEPASDQYALGVMLYEWLCGHLPFQGSADKLAHDHLYTPPPPLRQEIPPAVEAVVFKALSKNPQSRFVDVLSFASALQEASQAASLPQTLPTHPSRAALATAASWLPHGSPIRFHNLPIPLMPLLGREQVQQAARDLLLRPDVRLLTLTGAPGVGKTRLALALGAEVLEAFTHGVCFISLASISDPALVGSTLAYTLGLQKIENHSLADRLKAFLRDKQLVLLLDNFEQVLESSSLLTELLSACPGLTLLVTSRAVLHLEGEYEFAVPPLAVPDLQHLPAYETLAQVAAVALFVQRAQAAQPGFELTRGNAAIIAEICVRLDGLPLALVLAAARVKVLTPQALLARLKRRLELLTGGRQDAAAHQQTLRTSITWSYNLLSAEEQALFRRLCVFVGGCTLEAAEAVGTAPGGSTTPVLDIVSSLVDNSLLMLRKEAEPEPRLYLLETIREYGLEALAACGELERGRDAHAAYYLSLAERAEAALRSAEQGRWGERLERDHENIRVALLWLLDHHQIEEASRLATALQQFWLLRGYLSEGRRFLEQALEAGSAEQISVSPIVRTRALYAAGYLAFWQNDPGQAIALFEESERLSRQLQDERGIAVALTYLATITHNRGNVGAAETMLEEALRLCKKGEENGDLAELLGMMGAKALWHGEYAQARELLEKSLALFKALGDIWRIAAILHLLGLVAYAQGEYANARVLTEESLTHLRTLGKPHFFVEATTILAYELAALGDEVTAHTLLEEALAFSKELESQDDSARVLCGLGHLALRQGERAEARACFEEAITKIKGRWFIPRLKWVLATCLEGLGEIALAQGQATRAVQLFAAAETIRRANGYYTAFNIEQSFYERAKAEARNRLGEDAFVAAWTAGLAMTLEQALVAEGQTPLLKEVPQVPPAVPQPAPTPVIPDGLTAREVEILRLVAMGLSNSQIAERLAVSPNTVNAHIRSIYSKIDVSSRSAATRFAMEHHLI